VTLRRNVKHAIVVGLSLIGVLAWARRRLTQQRAIIVLMFHRILGGDDFARTNSVPGMVMRDATFDELLEHAARHAEIVQPNTADPGDGSRTARLLLTFDDGVSDRCPPQGAICDLRLPRPDGLSGAVLDGACGGP
jgi:hypothetical protein